MAFDGIVLRALTYELNQTILGGRVDKIYQPLARDLLLTIRNQGQNYRLLISANPSLSRVYFTDRYKGQNPTEPPMFCMLLRKHLEGGRITRIEQVDNERVLLINVENRDELGDLTEKQLIIEIMGRHSNIILVDPSSQRILDGIVHVNFGTSRHREVLPGRTYVAPPEQDKMSPLHESQSGFFAKRRADERAFDKFLLNTYSGISPLIGRELAYRVSQATPIKTAITSGEQPEDSHIETEWKAFAGLMEQLSNHDYQPTLVADQAGKPLAFSAVKLAHLGGTSQQWDSISACMDTFYAEKSWRDTLHQKVGDIERVLQLELDKNRNKAAKFKAALDDSGEADIYRVWGELITSSLYAISKGQTTAKVTNFYEEEMPEVEIPLDPQLSPQENAQAYFKKYNKVKKSVPILKEQIAQTNMQIAYLENVLQLLDHAGLDDLEEIREELEQEGILRAKHTGGKKKKPTAIKPEHFRSTDGIDIYVGKNNRQNDHLTMKLSQSADTWLHTKDIPGSHVLIRAKNVTDSTLEEAAKLAAYFSKARDSSLVPVDYTLVKNVWKPNGAKPGMVLYEGQKTVFVTPDPSLVEKLRV